MPWFMVEMTCTVRVSAANEAAASSAACDPYLWDGEPFDLDVREVHPDEEEDDKEEA